MGQYCVSIRSVSPDSSWIRRFLQEIAAHGGDTRQIAFFGLFHEDLKRPFEEASRMHKKAEGEATHVVQLLLHPRYHKHYLRDVSDVRHALESDPRVVLVYDLQDIPDARCDESKLQVVDQPAISRMFDGLRTFVDPERIMERSLAILKLADIVRLVA